MNSATWIADILSHVDVKLTISVNIMASTRSSIPEATRPSLMSLMTSVRGTGLSGSYFHEIDSLARSFSVMLDGLKAFGRYRLAHWS